MVTVPGQYVGMGWHQNRFGTDDSAQTPDGWHFPDAWHRPEFRESDRAQAARNLLDSYLADTPLALAHIGYLIDLYARPGGRATGRAADLEGPAGVPAIKAVAAWLDEVLYGQGRTLFGKEERYPLQVTADSMARGDFCRMNFRALVADCLEREVTPAPIASGRAGRPA